MTTQLELAIGCRLVGLKTNSKYHYIWGRPNWQFGADYIGKKNLSQKCGDLRCMESIWDKPSLKKPVITSHSTLKIAMLAFADITFLTNLQKREIRSGRLSL